MSTAPGAVEVTFVAPRHLAGGGDPAWITGPLHRACGWSHGNDPLMPRVLLSSPDQTAFLRLEPDPGGQWWRLLHAAGRDQPAWYASFGGHTPVELIAAVTDTLTDPAPTSVPSNPYDPLAEAGWIPVDGRQAYISLDDTVRVERISASGSWHITVSMDDRPIWAARFHEHTPVHLVTQFTTALADVKPLWRTNGVDRMPTLNPGLVNRRFLDVPVAYVAAALEERVDALASRVPAPSANQRPSPSAPRISPRRR
ncbi:DUF317 domain-containing protein [Streptomyces sp. 372A]